MLEKDTFYRIWGLGFLDLIGVRLKILYKDLFPNYRRFRAGLCLSPSCEICGEIETVDHMLFDCINAKRKWSIYSEICGVDAPDTLYDAICIYEPYAEEIVKTIVFKTLYAIDRGRHVDVNQIVSKVHKYANIERHSKYEPLIQQMLDRTL